MTEVQAQTLPVILDSNKRVDVLAKAKTGTGKTLGFLIPTVEKLLLASKAKRNNEIGCLIISPTRELAYQRTYQVLEQEQPETFMPRGALHPRHILFRMKENMRVFLLEINRLLLFS